MESTEKLLVLLPGLHVPGGAPGAVGGPAAGPALCGGARCRSHGSRCGRGWGAGLWGQGPASGGGSRGSSASNEVTGGGLTAAPAASKSASSLKCAAHLLTSAGARSTVHAPSCNSRRTQSPRLRIVASCSAERPSSSLSWVLALSVRSCRTSSALPSRAAHAKARWEALTRASAPSRLRRSWATSCRPWRTARSRALPVSVPRRSKAKPSRSFTPERARAETAAAPCCSMARLKSSLRSSSAVRRGGRGPAALVPRLAGLGRGRGGAGAGIWPSRSARPERGPGSHGAAARAP